MNKKIIYKSDIRWGWPLSSLSFYVFFLALFFIYLFAASVFSGNIRYLPALLVTFLPVLILNILFFPVMKSSFFRLLKKKEYDVILYYEGIDMKKKFLPWKKIKSISFDTGRLKSDRIFYEGFILLAFQKMFVLDIKGKEYSCIIDVDYFLKNKRTRNNLNMLRDYLVDEKKSYLISDWAEKR